MKRTNPIIAEELYNPSESVLKTAAVLFSVLLSTLVILITFCGF
jgi:hypothetical protein